jgi:hypothetical protein
MGSPRRVLWHLERMRSSHRIARLVLLQAGALICGGCFEFSTLVTVKGDGSGTIEQRALFPPTALAQIRGLRGLADASNSGFDPVSEQQARAMAACSFCDLVMRALWPAKASGALLRASHRFHTAVGPLSGRESQRARR